MTKTIKERDFKEKERIHTLSTGENEALHFSIVEVGGKTRADIRYFSKNEHGLWPTSRGILIDPKRLNDVEVGVRKLAQALGKK